MQADKIILCLPGGGALGAIQVACLARMEERLVDAGAIRWSIVERINLVFSTSVGAINGAVLASRSLNARGLLPMFLDALPVIFNRTGVVPKYSQKSYDPVIVPIIGGMRLGDTRTAFSATTVNACDEDMPIMLSSWNDEYGKLRMTDVIKRSSAAPVFFGGIVDHVAQAVWLDGGTGALNCPLLPALNAAMNFDWLNGSQKVHMLCVGTGSRHYGTPFRKAKRRFFKNFREFLCFADPDDGGLARKQAAALQIAWCRSMASHYKWFTFENLDVTLDPDVDRLDNIKDTALFVKLGTAMGDRADLKPFCRVGD